MLTSIVILAFNNRQKTQACLESIRMFTGTPYELILVDNASTDDTLLYLRQQTDIKLIANKDNKGFAAGCNQGMSAAKGDQIVLLNNDTVVSYRWLDNLLGALHSDPRVGIVGAMSNWVIPLQQMKPPYSTEAEYHQFAEAFNRHDPAKWREVTCLSGFCVMFRRALVEAIGLMDERFIFGVYEDADYSYRAMKAGYSLLLAGDTFVHHAGNSGFKGGGLDMKKIAGLNRVAYIRKWGFDPDRIAYVLDEMFLPGNAGMARHAEEGGERIPGGIVVKGGGPEVFYTERGRKRLIASAETFDYLRFKRERIVTISDRELSALPDGPMLQAEGEFPLYFPKSFVAKGSGSEVYWIGNGQLIAVASYADFAALKLDPEAIVTLPEAYIERLYYGYWPALTRANLFEEYELMEHKGFIGPDGAFYYAEGQKLRKVKSEEVMRFYHWSTEDGIPLAKAEFAKLPLGKPIEMPMR